MTKPNVEQDKLPAEPTSRERATVTDIAERIAYELAALGCTDANLTREGLYRIVRAQVELGLADSRPEPLTFSSNGPISTDGVTISAAEYEAFKRSKEMFAATDELVINAVKAGIEHLADKLKTTAAKCSQGGHSLRADMLYALANEATAEGVAEAIAAGLEKGQ